MTGKTVKTIRSCLSALLMAAVITTAAPSFARRPGGPTGTPVFRESTESETADLTGGDDDLNDDLDGRRVRPGCRSSVRDRQRIIRRASQSILIK